MSRKKPTEKEFAAILEDFANRNCPNGCKCILCREFEAGYRAGLEDASTRLKQALFEMGRK